MKKTALLIFAMLCIISAKAQQIKDSYSFDKKYNTIELDITKIFRIEQRAHILYTLSNDERFDISLTEKDGVFAIKPSDNNQKSNLFEDFKTFCKEEEAVYNSMAKEELGDAYLEWKALLPDDFVASIMMDYYIANRQNNLCANADPFCTDVGIYEFPAGVDAGTGESGPNYDCLHTTPNPAWYYMRIANPGNINIYMYSTPSEDIDFCCWGPFDDPTAPCPTGLTLQKRVSCSYSSSATETCVIPGSAQTGEYYILVITNYSNHQCNITFSKQSGTGTTDCSIMPPVVWYENSCYGGSMTLHAQNIANATYHWTGPNGFSSTQMNPTINNVTFNNSGTYQCAITVGSQTSDYMSMQVDILPQLTLSISNNDGICAGDQVSFTGNATTNGHDNVITSWERTWNFGDGGTATGQNVSHTFATPGTYTVTYTVSIENAAEVSCTTTKTKQITVNQALTASVTADDNNLCEGENTTVRATATGGAGNLSYSWSPNNYLVNPNSATTLTNNLPVGTKQLTCTVTDNNGHTDSKQVTITTYAMPVVNIVGDDHVGYNESATLSVEQPTSGATYAWTPANLIASGQGTATIHTVALTQAEPITFGVTVSKDGCSNSAEKVVTAGNALVGYIEVTGQSSVCDGESTSLKINPSGGSLSYTYSWQPSNMIQGSNTTQTITTKALTQTTAFTCTVSDTEGHSYTTPPTSITVKPLPEPNITAVNPVLINNVPTIITGNTFTLSTNNYSGASYNWEPASLIVNNINPWEVVVKPTAIGETTFSVTINNNGCEESGSTIVNVIEPISVTSVTSSEEIVCEDETVVLSATATGGSGQYSYSWEPSEWISGNSHSQSVTTKKLKNNITFTCTISDSNFPNSINGSDQKTKNITIHNKPTVDSQLVGLSNVIPGVAYMPYVYEYKVNEESLNGYDIEHASFEWSIFSYYNTPNHIPGTVEESSWLVYADEENNKKAYVYVDNYGNALLKCKITTSCGSVTTEKFIYTDGYNGGESIDELNYDRLINIFPNPSNGELYIGCSELISSEITISIYSYNGMLIDQFKGNTESKVTHHSMNGLSNGLYLVKISGDDFVVTKKFVLNK